MVFQVRERMPPEEAKEDFICDDFWWWDGEVVGEGSSMATCKFPKFPVFCFRITCRDEGLGSQDVRNINDRITWHLWDGGGRTQSRLQDSSYNRSRHRITHQVGSGDVPSPGMRRV